jgi:hypothetical protein
MSINTKGSAGRFGNHFLRNMVASILAEKNNLSAIYSYQDIFDSLNIKLYNGTNIYSNYINVTDENFMEYIINNIKINSNINLSGYYQTKDFCLYLKKYFDNYHRNYYNDNNPYKNLIDNNYVFIHVRLGDIPHFNHGFIYYDSILRNIKFTKGFISTDTQKHPIILELIKKYNLEIYDKTEADTILFGSICKNIILSNGTFSWLIGFLSNNSNVYYPDPKQKKIWHGDIFVYDEWIKCNYGVDKNT